MSVTSDRPSNDEIARVAYAIWEAEGQPEGRDHEHWMRARQLIAEGRAEVEFPEAAVPDETGDSGPRPVQPGFEDTAPGMVPRMKADPGPEIREGPGGRFAEQIATAPDPAVKSWQLETSGPRNPAPQPPTNAEGYVATPSVEDAAGQAVSDHPPLPRARSEVKPGGSATARPNSAGT